MLRPQSKLIPIPLLIYASHSFALVIQGSVLCWPFMVYVWCPHHSPLKLTTLGLASQHFWLGSGTLQIHLLWHAIISNKLCRMKDLNNIDIYEFAHHIMVGFHPINKTMTV